MLVSSNGGHLAQLLALRSWLSDRETSWVTFDTADVLSQLEGQQVDFAFHPTTRNIPNLLRNFAVAFRAIRRRRPDAILTTGAGVAVPFFVLAKMYGVPTVYIEVYDRLTSPTLTGRMCRPLASAFCVQWAEQLAAYPDAEVIGRLL